MNVVFENRIVTGLGKIGEAVGIGRKRVKSLSEKKGCPIFINEIGYPAVNIGKFVVWYEDYCREKTQK